MMAKWTATHGNPVLTPTATLGSSLPLYIGCIYNAQDTKWDVVAAS